MHPTCRISHCRISSLCVKWLGFTKWITYFSNAWPCSNCNCLVPPPLVLSIWMSSPEYWWESVRKLWKNKPYRQSTTSFLIHKDLKHQNRTVKIAQPWHSISTKPECLPVGKREKKKGNNMGKCKSRTNTLGNELSNPSCVKQLFFFTSWSKCWRATLVQGGNEGLNLEGIGRKFYFRCQLRGRVFANYRRPRKIALNSVLPKLLVVTVILRALWKIRKTSQKFLFKLFNVYIIKATIL